MPEPSPKPRIALGSDHAGFPIKETIRQFLENAGYPVDDVGTWSEESVDYPDYGKAIGDKVAGHLDVYGIAVCGTGIGISIAANKVPGVRACLIHENFSAHQGVEDDDLNVMCLGGLVVGHAAAWELIQTFLAARFSGAERHRRRLAKVAQLEG